MTHPNPRTQRAVFRNIVRRIGYNRGDGVPQLVIESA
jgi:hypothetical protein